MFRLLSPTKATAPFTWRFFSTSPCSMNASAFPSTPRSFLPISRSWRKASNTTSSLCTICSRPPASAWFRWRHSSRRCSDSAWRFWTRMWTSSSSSSRRWRKKSPSIFNRASSGWWMVDSGWQGTVAAVPCGQRTTSEKWRVSWWASRTMAREWQVMINVGRVFRFALVYGGW